MRSVQDNTQLVGFLDHLVRERGQRALFIEHVPGMFAGGPEESQLTQPSLIELAGIWRLPPKGNEPSLPRITPALPLRLA